DSDERQLALAQGGFAGSGSGLARGERFQVDFPSDLISNGISDGFHGPVLASGEGCTAAEFLNKATLRKRSFPFWHLFRHPPRQPSKPWSGRTHGLGLMSP